MHPSFKISKEYAIVGGGRANKKRLIFVRLIQHGGMLPFELNGEKHYIANYKFDSLCPYEDINGMFYAFEKDNKEMLAYYRLKYPS